MTEPDPAEPIDVIRKRFEHEWLLIAIEEIDELTTIPLRGRLIAHSPTRDPLTNQILHTPAQPPIRIPQSAFRNSRPSTMLYLTRSDHRLPDRHASAF